MFGYPRRLKVAEVALFNTLNENVRRLREAERQRKAIMHHPTPPKAVRIFYKKTTSIPVPRTRPKCVKWGERELLDILENDDTPSRISINRQTGMITLPAGYAYSIHSSVVLRNSKLGPLSVVMAWEHESGERVRRLDFVVHQSAYGEPYIFDAELPSARFDRKVCLCLCMVAGKGVLEIGPLTGVIIQPVI